MQTSKNGWTLWTSSIRTRRTFFGCIRVALSKLFPLEACQIETHFERAAVSVSTCVTTLEDYLKSVCGIVFTCLPPMSGSYWPCSCPKSRTKKRGAGLQMEAWCIGDHLKVNTLLQSWISIIGITYHRFARQRFQQASEQFPTKGLFHFSWCLMVLYYFWLMTWNMRLQCRAQEYSGHHGTFMLHCYIISEYNILCFFFLSTISWLAVMWAHWKTPAHGSEVLRVKDSEWTVKGKDSEWTVKGRPTWKNCAHGPTSGQSRAELLAPWKYFMIVKAMEDKDRSDGSRKFWFWSEFRSVKHTKGLDGQKRFVHRHCFEHLIIWVESLPMKPVVCFGAVALLRQDVHL